MLQDADSSFQNGRRAWWRCLIKSVPALDMIEELVPEELWRRAEPLSPTRSARRRRYPGGLPTDDRAALAGIALVLEGGAAMGPSPVERGRPDTEHRVIADAGGIPLANTVTGGNRHDSTQLIPLVEVLPTIRGKRGRPWQRPR